MSKPTRSHRKSVLLALGWYVHEIHLGVARYAAEADWKLESQPSKSKTTPPGWRGDGIISIFWGNTSWWAKYILGFNLPTVNLNDGCSAPNIPLVLSDNDAIGREMALEFLSKGYDHIAFFCPSSEPKVIQERMAGFKDEVLKAKKNFHLIDYGHQFNGPDKESLIEIELAKKLRSLPKPLAVGTQFDDDANYVARVALSAGLEIPDDIAIIGADNDPISARLGPVPLTSIDTNRELQGYKAAELLDDMMRGKKPPRSPIVIPVGPIWRRRSTERVATSCPIVSKAIKFIEQNHTKFIEVEDIVRASGSCRRTLFFKFEQQLGISPKKELLRRRIQYAKELLQNQDKKIETIATDCGFKRSSAFIKAFYRETGNKPSFFRSKNS